jgi:dipeptidyl aminopeptidase/acylaminoacyl peptidase
LAVRAIVDGSIDIWIKELDAGPFSRLTFDGSAWSPYWTPDGEAVTFTSSLGGDRDVWVKQADGTGEAELLYDNETFVVEGFWGPDGEWLLLRSGLTGARDIHVLRPETDGEELPLLAEGYNETQPVLSPDGRWLAYTSDETGSDEVYVRPFPDVNTGKWQVSTQGGIMPAWAHSGGELFFMDSDRDLIAVEFNADSQGPPVGEEEVLFRLPAGYATSNSNTVYGVTPDDQRFLMARAYQGGDGEAVLSELVLVQNFFEELRERMGN